MIKKKTASTQQSLDRALELIEMLSKTGASMNIADISKALKITRATASSLIQTLLHRNYIEKDPETCKFSIGYKIYDVAIAYRYKYPFLHAAGGHISEMAEKIKVKINVSVLKPPGVAVMILSKDISLLPKMISGYVLPGYASASGKLLMAYAPREIVEPWIEEAEFIPYTSKTIVNKQILINQFDQIRSDGFAIEDEEIMPQRGCVAAPIYDISGQVIASVSFSTSKERMDANLQELIQNVTFLSKSISAALGYNPIIVGTGQWMA